MQQFCVIMAGGTGERFWPISRRDRPKQLLNLSSDDTSLLQEAVDRVAPLLGEEKIIIATGAHLSGRIRAARLGIPDGNIIGEPSKRNTSGCLALAAAHLLARCGGDGSQISMAVITADHWIGNPKGFRDDVRRAMAAAESDDVLVTIGIVPSRSETGYGYIEMAEESSSEGLARVASFREKPGDRDAATFAASGRFLWNSGMFFWRVSTFVEELRKAKPALADATLAMARAIKARDSGEVERIFGLIEDVSIDYALMERSSRVMVLKADFPWDDVGSWDAIDRGYSHDDQGNVAVGAPVLIDTRDSIVYNERGAEEKAVAVIGVEGLAVIVSGDAVLVVPKNRAQEVRKAVTELKKRRATQL